MTETQTYGGYTNDDEATTTDLAAEEDNGRAGKSSPLDDLKNAIKAKKLRNPKTYQVDGYDFDIRLRFNAYISADEFKSFQKQASGATNRKTRRAGAGAGQDMDQFKLFSAILQEKSEAIIVNGKDVLDTEGDLLTLRSDEFISFVKDSDIGQDVTTVAEAIEAFLTAGGMVTIGESIATEAGFGGETEPVNP